MNVGLPPCINIYIYIALYYAPVTGYASSYFHNKNRCVQVPLVTLNIICAIIILFFGNHINY